MHLTRYLAFVSFVCAAGALIWSFTTHPVTKEEQRWQTHVLETRDVPDRVPMASDVGGMAVAYRDRAAAEAQDDFARTWRTRALVAATIGAMLVAIVRSRRAEVRA